MHRSITGVMQFSAPAQHVANQSGKTCSIPFLPGLRQFHTKMEINMNGRTKYLIKNIGILTLSNFATKILVFLLVPLYTSVLSTEEYGIYDMVVATAQLLFPLFSLNIVDAVMRFTMDESKNRDQIATIGFGFVLFSMLPVTVFLVAEKFFGFVSAIDDYLLLVFLYYVFYALYQYCVQLAKGKERVADMGIAGVLGIAVLIVGNIVFLLLYKVGLRGFFYANVLAQMIPTLYLGYRLKIWRYTGLQTIDKATKREMLNYCLPLIFTTVTWWVNNASDRYVVTIILGAAANGLLSVAYKIPSILNTVQQIFVQAWQISAIKEYNGNKSKEFYGTAFSNMNIVMCLCCLLLFIALRTIAPFLFKKDFLDAWRYVPFLLLAGVFNSASGFMGPILLARKDSKGMAKSAICGSILNIPLNIVLAFLIGIQGVTIATAASSLVIYLIRRIEVRDDIVVSSEWKIYGSWLIIMLYAILVIFEAPIVFQICPVAGFILINIAQIKGIINVFAKMTRRR